MVLEDACMYTCTVRRRRVTQQGVILYGWAIHAACRDEPHHLFWSGADDLLQNVHKKTIMSYVTQGRHGLVLYRTVPSL
jgi:hypothetical protein